MARWYLFLLPPQGELAAESGSLVSVYVGICHEDFKTLQHGALEARSAYVAVGYARSVASGRLSYVLGLQGACESIDTACSSALAALKAAAMTLRLDGSSAALAAGVNAMLVPEVALRFANAQMLSPAGRCHTFDNRADGFVRGEACCTVALAPVNNHSSSSSSDASVLGVAARQDGKSASLTAPNGQAQQALRLHARARAGTSVRQSAYAEYHGTGTILGDPIEAGSYAAVVQAVGGASDAIGSIKGNVGHSESGAGTSGLLTLTLHLKRLRASSNVQLRVANRRVTTALDQVLSVLPVQQAQLTLASGSM